MAFLKSTFVIFSRVLLVLGILGLSAFGLAYWYSFEATGTTPKASHLQTITASAQWENGRFKNRLAQEAVSVMKMLKGAFFDASPLGSPDTPIPFEVRQKSDFQHTPASGLRVTWFGHSSLLIEIEGKRILIDPVWGEHASPLPLGVKRFFQPAIALDDLPELDFVLISHDHYDHLDMETVKSLQGRNIKWFVPLGVGAHLGYWGVPQQNIREFDWWDAIKLGSVKITSVPARHSSGRALTRSDTKKTLWSGWAINGDIHSVFYSGDTSMHDEFREIGERLGPFDVSIIEAGAYNPIWRDNHLGPEQAVIANRLVQGKVMIPVHWGMFDLAFHSWTEPVERVLQAAEKSGTTIFVPKVGGSYEPGMTGVPEKWWPDIEWQDADAHPVWSTKVDHLIHTPIVQR